MKQGGRSGDGGYATSRRGIGGSLSEAEYQPTLDLKKVRAQAIPGRRFSKDSLRRGWLYVNTWYMIGPWDNFGRNDFAAIHPPEFGIDFDAVYNDGQRGAGIVETDSHPIEMRGKTVQLSGTLRWQFMQSESIHNTVPVTTDASTYYAYTELYFEEPMTLLVAIGTDDSGKVWINGEEIWQDRGMSWYKMTSTCRSFGFSRASIACWCD